MPSQIAKRSDASPIAFQRKARGGQPPTSIAPQQAEPSGTVSVESAPSAYFSHLANLAEDRHHVTPLAEPRDSTSSPKKAAWRGLLRFRRRASHPTGSSGPQSQLCVLRC